MKNTIAFLHERLNELGLLRNGEPISFTEFKTRINTHTYGRGKFPLRIHFIGKPKETLFGFYPAIRDTKVAEIKDAYNTYKYLVEGLEWVVEDEFVQWGNCGIPITYGDLRTLEKTI